MPKYEFNESERKLLESLSEPFAVYQFVDKHVVTSIISDGFCKLFGYADRAKAYHDMDNDMYKDTHPDDVARIADEAVKFATEGGVYDTVYRSKNWEDGNYHIIHAHGEHTFTKDGFRLAHVWYTDEGVYKEDQDDKAEAVEAVEKRLNYEIAAHASHYDYMTGLPSMTYFFELAEEARKGIHADGDHAVLLFTDLSGMKFYDEKYSFAEGDKLIKSFSELLIKTFGSDNCCHIGGDHFAVYSAEKGITDTLEKLFAEWKKISGKQYLPIRVGIYSDRIEDVPVSTACNRAKLACDAQRGMYESNYDYYHQEMSQNALHRQFVLENIENALKNQWIKVHYQPIVRTVNGRVCDEEALSRWIDPVNGVLYPDEFIPALEESKLIYKLDLYVLEQVLEKIKIQNKYGITVVPHSVNLSRSDFEMCDIVEEVRSRVDAAGVERDKITIEITESIIGNDFDFMTTQVERFRSLGFPVWMDDFGSGYSSLDVLQNIRFDLIKFDMNFLKKMDKGENGKIIMTELMRMATTLGVDTVCEGVETQDQVRFLREIGCSKLQGFHFSKAINFQDMVEGYKKGIHFSYENQDESEYFAAIGRVDLNDLSVIAKQEMGVMKNVFDTFPMTVVEAREDKVAFMRSNGAFRDFSMRVLGIDLSDNEEKENECVTLSLPENSALMKLIMQCRDSQSSALYDDPQIDGAVVHYFARRVGVDPVNGRFAVAIAVLSVTEPEEGTTYAGIAKALASDYYNIYYIDLDTDEFIEYNSKIGEDVMAIERHGKLFFDEAREAANSRIYKDDRESFLSIFTKENVVRELKEHGVFTTTYRLTDTGTPMYVNMKITRMPGGNHIIMGVSIIDAQVKQKELLEETKMERDALARIMTLDEGYLSLYSIDPETGHYVEYGSSPVYEGLGFDKSGSDFFQRGIEDGKNVVYEDDLPEYLRRFSKENVMKTVRDNKMFRIYYRLKINDKLLPVCLKIALVRDYNGEKLIAGVREWKERADNISFDDYYKKLYGDKTEDQ